MSQTRDQKRFAISEVAADWHELMTPQRIVHLLIACDLIKALSLFLPGMPSLHVMVP